MFKYKIYVQAQNLLCVPLGFVCTLCFCRIYTHQPLYLLHTAGTLLSFKNENDFVQLHWSEYVHLFTMKHQPGQIQIRLTMKTKQTSLNNLSYIHIFSFCNLKKWILEDNTTVTQWGFTAIFSGLSTIKEERRRGRGGKSGDVFRTVAGSVSSFHHSWTCWNERDHYRRNQQGCGC